jgi:predicted amidohydrolase
MQARPGDPEWNGARVEKLIQQAASEFIDGRTVICLPELFASGYSLGRKGFQKVAERIPGPTVGRLSGWAQRYGAYVCGGIPEVGEAGTIYDSSVLLSSQGKLLGKYRKIHLAGAYEKGIFSPGADAVVVSTKMGGIGLAICYDQVFPELARRLALAGADIVLHSSAWSDFPRKMDWGARDYGVLSTARAMENTVFFVSSNRTGVEGKFRFVGQTRVIAPWGEVLASRNRAEGCAVAKVDLKTLKKCRKVHPCLGESRKTQAR